MPLGGCERIQGTPLPCLTLTLALNLTLTLTLTLTLAQNLTLTLTLTLTRYATPLRVRRPPAQLPDRRAVRRALSVRVRVAVAGCVDMHAPGSPHYTYRPSSALRGLEWALLGPVTHDAPCL